MNSSRRDLGNWWIGRFVIEGITQACRTIFPKKKVLQAVYFEGEKSERERQATMKILAVCITSLTIGQGRHAGELFDLLPWQQQDDVRCRAGMRGGRH